MKKYALLVKIFTMRQSRLIMAVKDLGFIRVVEKFLCELFAPITV